MELVLTLLLLIGSGILIYKVLHDRIKDNVYMDGVYNSEIEWDVHIRPYDKPCAWRSKRRKKSIDEICAICLDVLEPIVSVTGCKHRFHPQCIAEWLKLGKTCPTCRNDLARESYIY